MSDHINRIRAEDEYRKIPLHQSGSSGDVAKELSKGLKSEIGVTVLMPAKRDEAGIAKLKKISQNGRKKS